MKKEVYNEIKRIARITEDFIDAVVNGCDTYDIQDEYINSIENCLQKYNVLVNVRPWVNQIEAYSNGGRGQKILDCYTWDVK